MALSALVLGAMMASAAPADVAAGVHPIVLTDAGRRDSVSPAHVRQWKVDLYYPARPVAGATARPYAHDRQLIALLIKTGYYDQPASHILAWEKKPGPALLNAPAARRDMRLPLIVIIPGSGVAAFNYSELAAALARRGYAVAVADLPYVGISRLADGRVLNSGADPIQAQDDPVSWRPRIREWSADVSRLLDRLLSADADELPTGAKVNPKQIVVTGHSMGGIVALQVCHDDQRVEGCGDFEGAPAASDTFDLGSNKPLFVTAARSAKPDRPFKAPDFGNPMWSYLRRDGPSSWAIAITKASHMSYSDAPFEMPDTLSRFGGELMSPERSFDVYVGLVDAFVRAYGPEGGGDEAFQTFVEGIPEILARRPADVRRIGSL
jgi:pimeloyl-ACP methyl ester carboxylesterase